MSESTTPAGWALTELAIPYTEYTHPGPVKSLEQAADERGQRPEQVVRSILFRLGKGVYAMVLVAGPQQIDWKALRNAVGQSRLTTASADEVRQVTGFEIGAVGPFGLPAPLPVYVDESVLAEEEISLGSGVRGTTVILKSADLMAALGDVERVSVLPD